MSFSLGNWNKNNKTHKYKVVIINGKYNMNNPLKRFHDGYFIYLNTVYHIKEVKTIAEISVPSAIPIMPNFNLMNNKQSIVFINSAAIT